MRFLELLPATRRTRGLAVGLVMAMLLAGGIWGGWGSDRGLGSGSRRLEVISQGHARPDLILKTEATDRYLGPAADRLEALPAGLPLRYLPSIAEPLLSVFRVVSLDNGGRVVPPAQSSGPRPYLGAACHESCLEIELGLDGLSGEIRLPVPTGHLLDTDSLRVEGGAGVLWAAPDGGPLLEIDGIVKGRVRYRTGAGLENQPSASGSWPVLPESADVLALSLRSLEAREAARVATDWVRRKVVYDTSQATVDRHRAAAGQDLAFARRCLEVGAGDCDVQNALLAAVLARAGLSVRMAVGFVGSQGRALPGLHAWVEYRSESGAWRAVDASRGAPPNSIPHSYPEVTTIPHQADEDEMPARSGAAETTSRIGLPSRTLVGLLSAILLALAGSWWFIRRRWAVRRVQSEEAPDLAGLLKGALARPEAYAEVPALFARRVVPVLGSSTISLDRARSLSRSGRLAVSFGSSEFARRAAEQGQLVIDGSRPEGKAVAATLGAIDLDRWDQIVRMSHEEPVTEVLEQAAQRVGEAWRVVIGSGLADEVIVLDVPLAGRCPVVVVDEGSALWKRVLGLTVDDPSMAVFVLADQVVERLQSPPGRKRRLLSRLAAEAVLERAGVSP